MRRVYTIGSFSGWRDELKGMISDKYVFDDPRNHDQSSIARLVNDDMNSAIECPISVIYTPKGKRAGTMSYAELGAAWAMGNYIISVDENEERDDIVASASCDYSSFDSAVGMLNHHPTNSRDPLKVRDRTSSKEPYGEVLFTGKPLPGGIVRNVLDSGRTALINPYPEDFKQASNNVDLIVANFNEGHDKKGLFYMGVGYALKIPVIMLEGNKVPYPPLLGLSRRVMVGEDRFDQLEYYLENLESQHISDEALVYYNLMKKFN